MKKLMFAAVAALAASVSFGIESANIVGYVGNDLSNFKFVGTSFQTVSGGETNKFSDLVVNCDETGAAGDTGWQISTDGIIMLDSTGTFVKKIAYVPQWVSDIYSAEGGKGWYDDSCYTAEAFPASLCYNDEEIPMGTALQIYTAPGFGTTITFAGQVKNAPTVTDLSSYISVANCSPVKIYAEDLVINCDETGAAGDTGWQISTDGIIMLDSTGTFVKKIAYVPQWVSDIYSAEGGKGWYDESCYTAEAFPASLCYNHSEDLCWNAGEGFQVYAAPGFGTKVTIKSALAAE